MLELNIKQVTVISQIMKILYVTHSLPIGGAEMIAVNYLLKLKERGEDVHLLQVAHQDTFLYHRLIDSGIPVTTLRGGGIVRMAAYRWFPRLFCPKFNRIIRRVNPDIIHFQTIYPFMDKLNFPLNRCVFTFHARVDRSLSINPSIKPLFEKAISKGLGFVAISSKIEEDIKKEFPQAKTYYIPNGIDLDQIRADARSKNEIRMQLGIPENAFVVGQVGRFNRVKNHLFTIDVFNVIAQRNDKAILALVGSGTQTETERLMERINKYGLKDKVVMLGLRDDASQLMSGFDAIIHPSFSESFSLVLIEAQANGIRCVASDAIPEEIVCNNNCFCLSLSDSPEQWAEKLMGSDITGDFSSLEKFDINTVTDQNIVLYQSLINA